MINITKDKFIQKTLGIFDKEKIKNNKIYKYIQRNKAIIILIVGYLLLTISNGFLVYNFFKTISKL